MDVKTFDDIGDFFAQQAKALEEANKRIQPWQAEIKVGDCFVRLYQMGDRVIQIYGEVIDALEAERQAGADEDEVAYVKSLYEDPGRQGFRFTKSYSVLCREGELGDVHVSTMTRVITRAEFESALSLLRTGR